MNRLYQFRGWILGGLALVLLSFSGAPFSAETFFFSMFLLLGAILLRGGARRSIGNHSRGYKHDADKLVTTEVYSKIRHPLYVSNSVVGVAFILFHLGFSWPSLPFVFVLLLFEIYLSKMEDRYLENRFGDSWRNWAEKTNAFFPKIKVREKNSIDGGASQKETGNGSYRSLGQAFASDVSTWFWLCVMIVLIWARKFFDFFPWG